MAIVLSSPFYVFFFLLFTQIPKYLAKYSSGSSADLQNSLLAVLSSSVKTLASLALLDSHVLVVL